MSETVVMLPGLMCDARMFQHQIATLSRFRPVAVMPVAFGERIEEIASTLLSSLPSKVALVGHGFGGVVAMEILRRAPDRIARLALISASPLAETPQDAAEREPRMIAAKAGRLGDVMAEEVPLTCLAATPHRSAIVNEIQMMAAEMGPEAYVRQSRALQRRRDQQGTLRRCKSPTLVMCGEADQICTEKRQSVMAELMPDAQLQVIPNAGHMPSLEAPDAVTDAIIDWLDRPFVLR